MKALLAARTRFERAGADLVEESEYRAGAGERSPAPAVAQAERRLGWALPAEYASLVTGAGAVEVGDSGFTRPEALANGYAQMEHDWGTPRAALEKELSAEERAFYRSGTILFTEAGDGYGGLLFRPSDAACGGSASYSWFHQDDLRRAAVIRGADGRCAGFSAAVLRVVGDQLFRQYDDTGERGVVVDRSAPAPFRLRLFHEGAGEGPGFRLAPDWESYE